MKHAHNDPDDWQIIYRNMRSCVVLLCLLLGLAIALFALGTYYFYLENSTIK